MSEKIDFELNVKKNELDSALDRASSKAGKLEVNLNTAVSVFAGNLLTKAFDVLVSGLGEVVDFTEKAIDAAAGQEVAVNNLNAALARAGNFTKEASRELQNFSSQLQATTVFEDDVVQSSTALLQSLTRLNVSGLKAGITAAADFATVLGVDLETATRLVAKAANGNSDAFARYGITVRNGKDAAETFSNVLDTLNSKFGGSASSQLNTYNGSLIAVNNAYADLLEPIGEIVVKNPTVIATFNALGEVLNGLNSDISKNNSALKEFVSDGIFAAIAGGEVLFNALDGITRVSKLLFQTVELGVDSILLGIVEPFRLAYEASTQLLSILPVVGEQFRALTNPLDELADSLRDNVVGGFKDLEDAIADDTIFTTLSEGTTNFGERLLELSEKATLSAGNIKNSNTSLVQSEVDKNAEILALREKFAADQKTFEESIYVASLEDGAVKNEAAIEAIYSQKSREAEAVYVGELAKNQAIKDADQKLIADRIASINKEESIKRAARERDLANTRSSTQARIALEKAAGEAQVGVIRNSFALAGALAKDGSREQFIIQKAAAIADIAIADGKARALIPAQTATIPYPANLAAIAQMNALVTAQTAIGSATVLATALKGFESGGIVGATNGPDNQLATVRTGELVLNAQQQKNLFDAINSGSFGGGEIIIQVDGREIARAVRNQVKSGFNLGAA